MGDGYCNKHYKRYRKNGCPKTTKRVWRANLTSTRFGKLLVIKRGKTKKYKKNGKVYSTRLYWLCNCDCGKTSEHAYQELISGQAKSCGCLLSEIGDKKAKYGSSAKGRLIKEYLNGAKHRKVEFRLSPDSFFELTTQNCYYCGSEPTKKKFAGNQSRTKETDKYYVYNGIDRLDSSKGYTPENCVPCCEWCNKMKLAYTVNDFVDHIHKIHTHIIGNFIRPY